MKYIIYLTFITAAFLFIGNSCSKDKGNYSYKTQEVMTAKGFDASYTKMTITDTLNIDPVVTSTEPDPDFIYRWELFLDKTTPVEIISNTKAVHYPITQDAGNWTLSFIVTNKKTGNIQYFTSTLTINTQFTCGWYVAKDDGSQTDVDLFVTSDTILPRNKLENVFSRINGKKIDGKAALFNYFTSFKNPAYVTTAGALKMLKVLFVMTDKELSVPYINTFQEINDFNKSFYSAPATKKPCFIATTQQINSFVNDGQLYCNVYSATNTGHYGIRLLKDDADSPYKLSKYFISFYAPPAVNTFIFDDSESTFYYVVNGGNKLGTITRDSLGTKMSFKNNNKEALYMGCKNATEATGYALFQDKTNPTVKTLATITPSVTKFFVKAIDTIKAADPLYDATNYALLQDDEEMLYFNSGNKVYARNLNNKTSQLQYTPPSGETITFIRHRKFSGTGTDARYSYNYVIVGTKTSSGNYKVRMFTKAAGNLANTSSPVITLEGTGSVGDVIFISPTITSGTYPSTY